MPTQEDPVYCVLKLHIENLSNISVVDITPKADVCEIVGRNQAGKSTVLDSVAWAISGIKALRAEPIRNGKNYAAVHASIGTADGKTKYVVERSLTRGGKPALVIKGADGRKLSTAESFFDELAGDLGFDPESFMRMKPKEQADELKRISGLGSQIDDLDRENALDFAARTDENRLAREAKMKADAIEVPVNMPAQRIDVAKLVDELQRINAHNTNIERRRQGRIVHTEKVADLRDRAKKIYEAMPVKADQIAKRRDERVEALLREIEQVKTQAKLDIINITENSHRDTEEINHEANTIQAQLDAAPPILSQEDPRPIQEKIESADEVNRGIAQKEIRDGYLKAASEAEEKAHQLTTEMQARTDEKMRLISEANIPVPGIGIEDGQVTLNGNPFSSASDGAKWRAVAGIAMSSDTPLRVCLIRRASLIDDTNIAIIKEIAQERRYQLFLEWVGTSEDHAGAIMLVDGTTA